MTRIYIYVEGQTEETFVRDVLEPAYSSTGIYFTPILAETSPGHKGGIVSYGKTKHQLQRLCMQDQSAYVTTMIDYYGLPSDFPSIGEYTPPPQPNIHQYIQQLETALEQDINQNNFIANYLLHEYEAILFSEPNKFSEWLDDAPITELASIRANYATPEHINNDPLTAPSKRIKALVPHYNKVLHGPLIAGDIGLTTIREQCPHFNGWLDKINALTPVQ